MLCGTELFSQTEGEIPPGSLSCYNERKAVWFLQPSHAVTSHKKRLAKVTTDVV
jgi:hypothetical protein